MNEEEHNVFIRKVAYTCGFHSQLKSEGECRSSDSYHNKAEKKLEENDNRQSTNKGACRTEKFFHSMISLIKYLKTIHF